MALGFRDELVPTPVNLGNPTEITVGELAQTVIELTRSPSRIVYKPLPVDDPRRRKPDIALAKQVLGWTPKVSLRKGLTKTIEWFAATRPEWDRVNSMPAAKTIREFNGATEEATL
jgi:UDP-glucuronate decarboxylase